MPNNKKQRGRDNQKKKEAHNEAQKKAEREKQLARLEQDLQQKFGTPEIDELLKELALSSSTAAEETKVVCYHGSVAKHFVAGSEYSQLLKTCIKIQKKNFGGGDYENQFGKVDEFLKKNKNRVFDQNFAQFVFAVSVSLYCKLTPREKELYSRSTEAKLENSIILELYMITQFAIDIRYSCIPKGNNEEVNMKKITKYKRDIDTERGLINCLHRETKRYCTCMVSNKIEAKDMDKMEPCAGCGKMFPKDKLKACKKCNLVWYCSLKCCEDMWPMHKKDCQYYVRVRGTGMPTMPAASAASLSFTGSGD